MFKDKHKQIQQRNRPNKGQKSSIDAFDAFAK